MCTITEGGELSATVATDEDGFAVLSIAATSFPVVVLGQALGHACARKLLLGPPEQPVVLRLPAAASLEGTVELQGRPVGAGVLVLAVPESVVHSGDVAALLTRPDVHVEATDAAGSFVLSGLEPEAVYQVAAGDQGYVQLRAELVQPSTQDFIRLPVERAYALHVRFVDETGAPAHVEQGFGSSEGMSARLEARGASLVSDRSLAGQLALHSVERALARNERRFLAACPNELSELEPLAIDARFPGYEPLELRLTMPPLSDAVAEVRVRGLVHGWGELELRVSSPGCVERDTRRVGPSAMLYLAGDDGTRLARSLEGPLFRVHRFRDIPAGRYRATLRGEPDTWELPAPGEECVVSIGAELAHVAFVLEGVGGVLFDVRAPDGEPFDGRLALALGRGPPHRGAKGQLGVAGRPAFFERPPYFLPALEPGEYTVAITQPLPREPLQSFAVAAGEATTTVVFLERSR